MKTQTTFTRNNIFKSIVFTGAFMMALLTSNSMYGQTQTAPQQEVQNKERTVKGIVTDDTGPVENATVILKGTSIYANTDEKGAFTFPKKLKENDMLVVNLMGYENKEVTIGANTTFVDIVMDQYAITLIGALRIGNNDTKKDNN